VLFMTNTADNTISRPKQYRSAVMCDTLRPVTHHVSRRNEAGIAIAVLKHFSHWPAISEAAQ
jgi:hypothetical protein